MAGSPLKKARVTDLQQQVEDLTARLQLLQATSNDQPIPDLEPATLTEENRASKINELLARAEQGETPEEIASTWNIDSDTLKEWAKSDIDFGRALLRARTRAKASVFRLMRTNMQNGRSVAGSMIDRLAKLYEDATDGGPGAERLVVVHKRARAAAGDDA